MFGYEYIILESMDGKDYQYLIYGYGRYASKMIEDFIYMFPNITIAGRFLQPERIDATQMNANCRVILCTNPKDRKHAKRFLHSCGISNGRIDIADDFFYKLDEVPSRVFLYGNDIKGKVRLLSNYFRIRHRILDENSVIKRYGLDEKHGYSQLSGKRDLEIHLKHGPRFVYIFKRLIYAMLQMPISMIKHEFYSKGMCIEDRGVVLVNSEAERIELDSVTPNSVITVPEYELMNMASSLFRATYYDKRQNEVKCNHPASLMWIGGDAKEGIRCSLCPCPEFMRLEAGLMPGKLPNEIWNSTIARIIRLTLINRTYTFCSRELCRAFIQHEDKRDSVLERRKIQVKDVPDILLAFDNSCNLHCPSCRKEVFAKNSEVGEKVLQKCTEELLSSGWLEKCDYLTIGGGGETFVSPYYKKVLFSDSMKRKNVSIMTNGTLFDHKMWNKLEGKYEHVRVNISIDAATEETYKKLRAGGNYSKLMENMEMISDLRREGKIEFVDVNMVVQRDNYKEMKDFVVWAEQLGFDQVYFSNIWNIGTYSHDEFKDISMFDENGIMKPELKNIIDDPIFLHKCVNMRWEANS